MLSVSGCHVDLDDAEGDEIPNWSHVLSQWHHTVLAASASNPLLVTGYLLGTGLMTDDLPWPQMSWTFPTFELHTSPDTDLP